MPETPAPEAPPGLVQEIDQLALELVVVNLMPGYSRGHFLM
jgi:hypothetical protein